MNESEKVLYVSGAPLLLAGFNGEYHFCGDEKNPRWSRPIHFFMGIPIRPTVIKQLGADWVLSAEDGHKEVFDCSVGAQTPLGSWESWAQVSNQRQPVTEFYHSYGKKILYSCAGIGAVQFILCNLFPSGTGFLGYVITFAAGFSAALLFCAAAPIL